MPKANVYGCRVRRAYFPFRERGDKGRLKFLYPYHAPSERSDMT
jgi:hypothetical protein